MLKVQQDSLTWQQYGISLSGHTGMTVAPRESLDGVRSDTETGTVFIDSFDVQPRWAHLCIPQLALVLFDPLSFAPPSHVAFCRPGEETPMPSLFVTDRWRNTMFVRLPFCGKWTSTLTPNIGGRRPGAMACRAGRPSGDCPGIGRPPQAGCAWRTTQR